MRDRAEASDGGGVIDTPHVATCDLARQIGFRLRFTQAALWKDLLLTFRPFRLRPPHYAALVMINDAPGLSQQDLSAQLGLKGPNLVSLINDLSKRGLVERHQRENDRRVNGLFLTGPGARVLVQMTEAHARHQARIAAVLSPEDRARLVTMLESLERIGGDQA